MSDTFGESANDSSVSLEVLRRVASMASGGMDTLPTSAMTLIKTSAVLVVIGVYDLTDIR